jgi:uncharacterized repeat protein (TIGR01451 family)/LPXTG-motif cell wall-anchored protein
VQIGNVVWLDLDQDGIQDPSEPPIPNVTVTLVDSTGTPVGAPILTDVNGEWYFDIDANSEYTVRFDVSSVTAVDLPPGVTAADLALTLQNATGNTEDTRDSDAFDIAGVYTIDVDEHLAGHNDHTYDIGFFVPRYDLALIKTVSPTGPVAPGSTVDWTVRIENQGNVSSGDFTVTDTLPSGLTYVSATVDGAAVAPAQIGQVLTFAATDLPDLAVGASTVIVISTTVSDVTQAPFRNWAEISSDSGISLYGTPDEDSTPDTDTGIDDSAGFGTDPTSDAVTNHNDSAFDSDADTPLPGAMTDEDDNDYEDIDVTIVYDLALVKVTPLATVDADDDVVWNIRVRNQGNVASGEFVVTDKIPAGMGFVSAINSGAHAAGIVTWAISDLAPGTSLDLSYSTSIVDVDAAPFRNWAEISSDSGVSLYGVADKDSAPDNDTGSDGSLPNDEYVGIDDLDDVVIDQVTGDEDDNDDAAVAVNPPVPPSTTIPPVATTTPILPATGVNSGSALPVSALLLIGGLVLLLAARRRGRQPVSSC